MNKEQTKSTWIPVSKLQTLDIKPRQWLVHDWIPIGQPTLLYGDGGSGKSLVAKQLCAAVAMGHHPWLGLQTRTGKSLFFTAEDDTVELHRRLADICASMRIQLSDLNNMEIMSLVGEDASLATHTANTNILDPSPMLIQVETKIKDFKPNLVVLDTLADVFPADENQRLLARKFIGMLRAIAYQYNCAILILAHPSRSGLQDGSGTSGSTGWSNSVRSRIYLKYTDAENPNLRTIELKKSNYSQINSEISVSWERGVFVPFAMHGRHSAEQEAYLDKLFLDILDDLTMKGHTVNSKSGSNYAPTKFSNHPLANGITKNAFKLSMKRLMREGRIEDTKPSGARATKISRIE